MTVTLAQAEKLFHAGKYKESISLLESLHQSEPQSPTYPANLSFAFRLIGKTVKAIEWGELAFKLDSAFLPASLNLGMAYLACGEIDKAMTMFVHGLKLDPNNALLWNGIGMGKNLLNKNIEAIRCYEKSLSVDASNPGTLSNLANSLTATMNVESAVKTLRQALENAPQHQMAATNLAMIQQYHPQLEANEVLSLLHVIAKIFPTELIKFEAPPMSNASIARIGFVSCDFYKHTVGRFVLDLLKTERPEGLEFYCYSSPVKQDEITDFIRSSANRYFDIKDLTDSEAAELIHNHNIDLLIDLNGHTGASRLKLFRHRPAEKQASWLGFPASTGVPAIDYALIGEDQITPGIETEYSEKIIPLKGCQYNLSSIPAIPIADVVPSERKGFITFGCFNNPAKITDEVRQVWVDILRSIPNSKLILKWQSYDDEELAAAVRAKFHDLGLAADRVELQGRSVYGEMLDQYNEIDVALDPFPFTGAMSTLEALWMGVPVVTLASARPVSRQGYSILKNIGLEKFTCDSIDEYKQRVIELADAVVERENLKSSLRSLMQSNGERQLAQTLSNLEAIAQASA